MARDRDGWEYTKEDPRWAPTVEIAMGEITNGLYGDEYEQCKAELDDLVRAARRDAVEELKAKRWPLHEVEGAFAAADFLFPDYPKESDSE
ncbi:hypothetical protein [Streptomyces sp. NPDC048057]|uniref:hypothetical protein n=1 Tax=Streptomyces sp. NPDC048057 TaxID=3155628 RepID=UPI0033EE27CA